MKQYDFAIIGGGIAGASVAGRLAERHSVLLLEAEPAPGYHATGRSAALYSALYGNSTITAITRASRSFMESPPHGFSQHPLLSPRGVLYTGSVRDAESIEALCGLPKSRRVSTREALELVPYLLAESAAHCALEEDAFDVDVNALHQGFLRMLRGHGGEIACSTPVTGVERCEGRWEIHSSARTFRAAVLINAAGAWADRVAQLAGARPVGLQPLRRTALLIDSPDPGSARWPAVIAGDESYYFKPDAGMLLASPADETPSEPCDAQPENLDIAICADRIETHTRLEVKRVIRSWAGLRTFAPDRTPVVGFDPDVQGFFWLAGQGGYGMQTAPALSDIASCLAQGKPAPGYLIDEGFNEESLQPSRFTS